MIVFNPAPFTSNRLNPSRLNHTLNHTHTLSHTSTNIHTHTHTYSNTHIYTHQLLMSNKLRLECGYALVAYRHEANIGNKSFKTRVIKREREKEKGSTKSSKNKKIISGLLELHFDQKQVVLIALGYSDSPTPIHITLYALPFTHRPSWGEDHLKVVTDRPINYRTIRTYYWPDVTTSYKTSVFIDTVTTSCLKK